MGELEECKGCLKYMEKGCIISDIERAIRRSEEIPICPNLLDLVLNQPSKRQPQKVNTHKEKVSNKEGVHSKNSSQVKSLSAAQKDSLSKGELPKNPQGKSTPENRKGSHVTTINELKGSLSGGAQSKELLKLTNSEREILRLISEEYLTIKQIAIKQRCSKSIIYRHVRNLKKKGVLNGANLTVHKFGSTCEPSVKSDPEQPHAEGSTVHRSIRLHGQEINVGILHKDERYKKRTGQVIMIDGNTIRCYRNSLEIYSGRSFFADDVQKATSKSMEYWTRFFVRLEYDLKIILVKPRAQNIKLVKQEYAEVGNELATKCEINGDKIKIYAKEDGKLWFTIDNSYNLREAETQHPETAKEDMEKLVRHFNDIRDNDPSTLSELQDMIRAHSQAIIILQKTQLLNESNVKPNNQALNERSKPRQIEGYQ